MCKQGDKLSLLDWLVTVMPWLRRIKSKKAQIHQSKVQDQEQESSDSSEQEKGSSDSLEQRPALRSVNLSALDLEPNLKQFENVDDEAQGTGVEVECWDKESTFQDNGMFLSRQCRPTGSFWCALHRPMC